MSFNANNSPKRGVFAGLFTLASLLLSPLKKGVLLVAKLFLIDWVYCVSLFSRRPGYYLFVPFPFVYPILAWRPDLFLYLPTSFYMVYNLYFVSILFYCAGCWLLFFVHESKYKEPVTEYLGGGKFLFDLLGSPLEKYGDQRDHQFRAWVVPVLTLASLLSVQSVHIFHLILARF